MRRTIHLLLVALLAFGILAAGTACSSEKGGGASLSSFTAENLDGDEVNQEIFSDYKLTMINIWATFCQPCLGEMPELGELSAEYADKGVRVVGIVADVMDQNGNIMDSQVELARSLVESTGADYLHLLPSADLIQAKLRYVNAVPETIFVDSEGKQVGESYLGAKEKAKWAAILDALLKEVD